jgi:hypothetical protein
MISVHVEDETDDNGSPIVTIQYVGESTSSRKDRETEAKKT